MRRSTIQVEVILLGVLTVVAFTVGQAEQAFVEDRVYAVPQGQGEAEALLVVGDAGQAVLALAVLPRHESSSRRFVAGSVLFGTFHESQ
jgi:hypothetical protein